MFAEYTGKHLCQRLKLQAKDCKKETLVQVFSCEFWEIFKNTFFTEHLRKTASAISFSEGSTRGVLRKSCSWKFCTIRRKTPLVCEISKNIFFYGTPLDNCFWLFHIFSLSVSKDNQIFGILEWQKQFLMILLIL